MGGLFLGLLGAVITVPAADYHFEVRRTQGVIYDPWTLSDDKVELRSYVGSGEEPGAFVAPTIHVAPGERLTISIHNLLEACTQTQRQDHLCFNDTNLHTHGMWVSPSGHSDNVLVSIHPGETFRYEYQIPADHPAGTFWYHPHQHGAGFVQVGSGMAGALIVTGSRTPTATTPGDIDILLKDENGRPFPDRVMLFQQFQYGCINAKGDVEGTRDNKNEPVRPFTCAPGETGSIESFVNDWGWQQDGRFTGINGKVEPRLPDARTGAFERWRLINAGTGESMHMRLYRLDPAAPALRTIRAEDQAAWRTRYCVGQPLQMYEIAMDGLTRSAVRSVDEAILFPGERRDLLISLPHEGLYCVINDTRRNDPDRLNPSRMVALIAARGAGPRTDTDALLKSSLTHAAESALTGPVLARVIADLHDGLKLGSFTWHKSIPRTEVSDYREVVLDIFGEGDNAKFVVNGRTYDGNRIDAVLPLGKAEEWRAVSLNEDHPLHIHVNPFQIVSIEDPQGRDATDPKSPAFDPDYAGLKGEWKDTVLVKKDMRVTFRTRYERFTGDFLMHCHISYHGDHGMMENLRISADQNSAAMPMMD
jgi:FtsP/CotA-like multicopper oxidase with cupredoxin domain